MTPPSDSSRSQTPRSNWAGCLVIVGFSLVAWGLVAIGVATVGGWVGWW